MARSIPADSVLVTRSLLLVCAAVFVATGCSDPGPVVEVHDLRLRSEPSSYPTLSGYVVNVSEAAVGSADVFVTLYDEDNQPLGDELVQVRRVEPGDSARFERRLDRAASAARLRHVTAG